MLQKRYQFLSKDGVEWTNWFNCKSKDKEPVQMKLSGSKELKNEYKTI